MFMKSVHSAPSVHGVHCMMLVLLLVLLLVLPKVGHLIGAAAGAAEGEAGSPNWAQA